MSKLKKDYTGQTFGRLKAVKLDSIRNRGPYWLFECSCGNTTVKCLSDVLYKTKSCGCLRIENVIASKRTHGETDSRLYRCWENMKKRCYSESSHRYKSYGARGITVCEEWKNSYTEFSEWAKNNGYKENLTIERIDPDGNYEPSNCTWITMKEQAKNRTTNHWIFIDGKKYSPEQLAEMSGIKIGTIYARIGYGDTGEDVIRPLRSRKKKTPR